MSKARKAKHVHLKFSEPDMIEITVDGAKYASAYGIGQEAEIVRDLLEHLGILAIVSEEYGADEEE